MTTSTTTTTTTTTSTTEEEISYTFVIPNQMYRDIKLDFVNKPIGQISSDTIEISKICNPNYKTSGSLFDCDEVFRRGQCESFNVWQHLRAALKNADGLWETRLNCPQCGCGFDALDLNEMAENEGWRTT